MQSLVPLIRLTFLLLLFIPSHPATAVDIRASADPASTALTAEAIKTRITEIEADSTLDEAMRTRLTDLYNRALSQLEKMRVSDTTTDAYTQSWETAAAQTKTIRDNLIQAQQDKQPISLDVSDATPLAEIDQQVLIEKANQAAVEAKLAKLEEQIKSEADRPTAARQRLTDIAQRQEELATESKLPAPADELPALTEARRLVRESETLALNAELGMLDQELLSQPVRIDLLNAQRDKTAFSLERIRSRVQLLENMLSSRRLAEAEQAKTETEEAQRAALGKHPLVQEAAEYNAALSTELATLAIQLEQALAENNATNYQVQQISEDFSRSRQKLELAGLNQALGLVLLEQRRNLNLPERRAFRKRESAREQAIASAGLRQLRYVEELRTLENAPKYIEGLTAPLEQGQVAAVQGELEEMVQNRRKLLEKNASANQAYLRALSELDFTQNRLIETISSYDDFLAEHLLWIRSRPILGLEVLQALPSQLAEVLSPDNWEEVLGSLVTGLSSSPGLLLVLAIVGLLQWKRRTMRTALETCSRKIVKIRTDRFRYTLDAVVLTLLLAASWPLLMAGIGWQLGQELDASVFTKAASNALLWVAAAWFNLRAFYMVTLPGGLAEAHFRWPADSLRVLRRTLRRLILIFVPATFIGLFAINHDSALLGGGIGRIAIIVLLLALAIFFYRLFVPVKGVLALYFARHKSTLFARLRHLWLALAVAIPLGLAVLAFIGYTYTTATLTGSLLDTFWLFLLLVGIHQLVFRWLLLTRRQLAFQAALDRREQARAAEAAREAAEAGEELVTEQFEEPEIDLATLSEESRQLLNVALVVAGIIGIWIIWSDVLPAFGYLDKITLWESSSTVEGKEQLVPVTLAKVLLAVLVITLTIVGTKRLPAFLDIAVLRHLNLTAGGRYATATMSRYLIATVGILLAINMIGGSWAKLQWLVAALGVGIGFGLQEIVANFISGIIILFERPIRIGDYVSVGETDGFVTRIQIRATTIQTLDRKELLVPNKEFITSHLLNWSLSDPITRLSLPVGIAYGGDVQQAMRLMAEAAAENERVLEEPFPRVAFETFGDNALLLTLRCFIESLDYRLQVTTELNTAINDKFNAAGIVIAFPQRDVHLDTSRPLDIRVHRETGSDTDSNTS